MSLNIKNEKTHGLVRELARVTGESMTAAVDGAVQERLERVRRTKMADWRAAAEDRAGVRALVEGTVPLNGLRRIVI
ncbi:MAG TPA: type II toxin-antitoxin system VapB family antitoxin [Candidatus Acidoferrum sp.]|nr:type II toxin-antitoxin system VapB family antitoxin [Candidatus Acidoferrum sp.]